jgi:hypothetical protein
VAAADFQAIAYALEHPLKARVSAFFMPLMCAALARVLRWMQMT